MLRETPTSFIIEEQQQGDVMSEIVLKQNKDGSVVYVSDVQAVLLEMLKDVHDVCERHRIPYFLNGGSALGAYRHQGFIPWDDDVDIAMMDIDFERFLQVISKELSDNYVIDAFELKDCYNVCIPAMKIRKKNTYVKEVNTLLKNKCKDSDGLFIDVFVYSHISDKMIVDLPFRLFNVLLMPILVLFENIGVNPVKLKKLFKKVAKVYGKLNAQSPCIGFDLTWTFKNPLKPFRFKKDVIYPVKKMMFEGHEFYVANKIETYLSIAIAPTFKQLPKKEHQKPKHIVDINLNGDKP